MGAVAWDGRDPAKAIESTSPLGRVVVRLTRAMRSMLFGISATDPAIFALAGCGMALVALGACLVPAARAARVDPMVVLREE